MGTVTIDLTPNGREIVRYVTMSGLDVGDPDTARRLVRAAFGGPSMQAVTAVKRCLRNDDASVWAWQEDAARDGVEAAGIALVQRPGEGFSVHMVVMPEDRPAYLTQGDYDLSLLRAFDRWSERVTRLQKGMVYA